MCSQIVLRGIYSGLQLEYPNLHVLVSSRNRQQALNALIYFEKNYLTATNITSIPYQMPNVNWDQLLVYASGWDTLGYHNPKLEISKRMPK